MITMGMYPDNLRNNLQGSLEQVMELIFSDLPHCGQVSQSLSSPSPESSLQICPYFQLNDMVSCFMWLSC